MIEKMSFGGRPSFSRLDLFEEISKTVKISRSFLSKKVYALKQNGFIEYKNEQDFILTPKGLRKINFVRLENLKFDDRKKDGLWRLIIFDIPERRRGVRELLRYKLLEFDFYQLQKSVYVTPYVCENEIAEVCKILDLGSYVSVILAKSLGNKEPQIVKRFAKV